MKTSILMCTYNGAKYIVEQLQSIYSQSLKPDELVIIDDCSTDNTIAIIEKFIKDNSLENTWKIFQNKENKGWRINFHDGISLVSGDLLFFSDQDDIWEKYKLEKMVEFFRENSNINVLSSVETTIKNGIKKMQGDSTGRCERVLMNGNGENFLIRSPGCAMGIRMQYYQEIKSYYSLLWAHDDFFWKFSALDGSGYLWHMTTVLRRIHGTNASIVKHRNRSERIQLIERDISKFEIFIEYCQNKIRSMPDSVDVNRIKGIEKYMEYYITGLNTRKDYLQTKKISLWFALLVKYRLIYHSPKVFFGDLII